MGLLQHNRRFSTDMARTVILKNADNPTMRPAKLITGMDMHRVCRKIHHTIESSGILPVFFKGLACLAATVLITFAAYPAASQNLSPPPDAKAVPWHITADELSYIETENVYLAEGDVIIEKGNRRIAADQARFDRQTMEVLAAGRVVMTVGNDILTADSVEINLATEQGIIHNGSFFLAKDNFHIQGDTIRKTGKESYAADKASITTCDGDTPAWKITGRNLKVTIEGYGFARHATFWVKNIPVMYTPFIVFPVKLKRQTGLLPPQLGTSSRKGFEIIQPFFWAVSQSADMTFYEHYMDLRGNKLGAELRYVFSPLSKGTLMFDYLQDKQVDDGTGTSSSDWGYDDRLDPTTAVSEDIPRPNHDRYWLRMKHDQDLPAGFSADLDVDVVSDQDYLHEFKSGYTGFSDTRRYFNDEFGRDIDDYNDPVRLNRLSLVRRWSSFVFNTELRWYDDVVSRRQGDSNTTVQRLPSIQFDGAKQPLLGSPFYFTLDNEYTYFYRQDTVTANAVTQDHRVDLYPRIYLPMKAGYYFTFEPSLGVRETAWRVEARDDGDGSLHDRETLHREILDGRADLSTEVYRIYSVEGKRIDRIKHSVKPQLTYKFLPEINQDAYPNFDATDRIARQNKLTYSLTNLLIYRSGPPQPAGIQSQSLESTPSYRRFLRLFVSQDYDFNEAVENDPAKWRNRRSREPFSPLYGKIEFTPAATLSMAADAQWSCYRDGLLSHNISANVSNRRGDGIFVEHRFQKEIEEIGRVALESLYTRLNLKISERLSASGEYEKDLYHQEDLLLGIGTRYQAQCWSLELKYTQEVDEEKYSFMVGLKGLGELGNGL